MYNIQPFIGLGNLKLGMGKSEIRQLLNEPFTSVASERDTVFVGWYRPQSDYFKRSKIKVEYDESDQCTFIEMAENTEAVFEGVQLFKLTYRELLEFIKKQDPNVEEEAESFSSPRLGIAATATDEEDYLSLPASLLAIFAK